LTRLRRVLRYRFAVLPALSRRGSLFPFTLLPFVTPPKAEIFFGKNGDEVTLDRFDESRSASGVYDFT
jgi:hypothetical protein